MQLEKNYFAHFPVSLDSFLLYEFEALACHLVDLLQELILNILPYVIAELHLALIVAAKEHSDRDENCFLEYRSFGLLREDVAEEADDAK